MFILILSGITPSGIQHAFILLKIIKRFKQKSGLFFHIFFNILKDNQKLFANMKKEKSWGLN